MAGKYSEKEKIFFVEERKTEKEGGKYLEFNLEVWSLTIPWFSAVTPLLGLQSLPAIVNCAYCKKDNLTAKKMAALISLEIYGSAKRLRG